MLKGTTEKEKTDRLRERRKKKSAQRVRHKERERTEKAVDKVNPGLGNKHAKARVLHNLQKAEKEGTVSLVSFTLLLLRNSSFGVSKIERNFVTLHRFSYRSRTIERKLPNLLRPSSNNCKKTCRRAWTRLDRASRKPI